MTEANDKEHDVCRYLIHRESKRCQKGVADKRFGWRDPPCFNAGTVQICEHRAPFTAEEKRQDEVSRATMNKMFDDLHTRESDICPHCKKTIVSMSQVGRCVYARPCDCRLWQGAIPEAWK